MHVEVRGKGKERKYYLAHSYRRGGRINKLRIYLGAGLGREELEKRRALAESELKAKIRAREAIGDPFQAALSPGELGELRALEPKGDIRVLHLHEEDWCRFAETFAYNTNAIEGSKISEKEAADILERDRWPAKPKEDISETYGVAKAIDFIRRTKEHLSLALILELHRIVFGNSKPFAGRLRQKGEEVAIRDASGNVVHRGAPSAYVRQLLEELVGWYERNRSRYPPLVLAATVHNQFENIHPFRDGNGRVGRLLLNNILIKNGLPPLSIELRNRQEYYGALLAYETEHNLRPTIELMLKEYRALRRMLKKGR